MTEPERNEAPLRGMERNSSGIVGWVDAERNPGFPLHTFVGKRHCRVCGLVRYKAVHAETAKSEKRRRQA